MSDMGGTAEVGALAASVRILLLLSVANTAPIVAKRLFGARWSLPLDGGLLWRDRRPVLGPSKTVRGLVVAVLATSLAALALGLTLPLGALLAMGSMAGDVLSSFIKRRLGIASSDRAVALDQVPEALLPLLLLRTPLDLSWTQVVAITAVFGLLEVPLARLFHRLGWRERPY